VAAGGIGVVEQCEARLRPQLFDEALAENGRIVDRHLPQTVIRELWLQNQGDGSVSAIIGP
jgi:hypothetical protein